MIIFHNEVRLNPEHRAAAIEGAARLRSATLTEPGCLDYRFAFTTDDENVLLLIERWTDESTYTRHTRSAALAEFGAAMGTYSGGPWNSTRFDIS